ncbi:MAG: hypothetical protein JO197_06520 [Acidobacteria bacterium]|nr:hypothetical protein [Acidobacteriota bacterium]MBV9477508.1 hypothetical protein [Acidobacteriota bacterium]
MKRILFCTLLFAPSLFAADVTGAFEANTKYEAPVAHAPANVSRMFAREVHGNSIAIPATGDGGMIVLAMTPSGAARTRLTTPDGAVLEPSENGSLERGLRRFAIDANESAELGLPRGANHVLHVLHTTAARYRLDLDTRERAVVVAAEPDSSVTLSTWAEPLSRQPGEPVTLVAELRDGNAPITGAHVVARLASPDGHAFDAVALVEEGNGVYRATLADLPSHAPGAWQARFDADGLTPRGAEFARTGSGELVAERGAADVHPRSIHADVVGDVLRVSANANVHVAGNYRFDVIVAHDGTSLAWGESARELAAGNAPLAVDIPLALIGNRSPDDLLLDVRLLGLDAVNMGVAASYRRSPR